MVIACRKIPCFTFYYDTSNQAVDLKPDLSRICSGSDLFGLVCARQSLEGGEASMRKRNSFVGPGR